MTVNFAKDPVSPTRLFGQGADHDFHIFWGKGGYWELHVFETGDLTHRVALHASEESVEELMDVVNIFEELGDVAEGTARKRGIARMFLAVERYES